MRNQAGDDGLHFPPRGGSGGQAGRPPQGRWKSARELPDSWRYDPTKILLGHDGTRTAIGRVLGITDNRHFVIVAGSRSGKTKTLLIPNLLRYPGSVVVFDPKGELARRTAAARRRMGQRVIILDPFPMKRNGLPRSNRYNLFEGLQHSSPENILADVAQVADAIIEGNKRDPHWTDSAKNLLVGLILLALLKGELTIRYIRRVLTDPAMLLQAWTEMSASDAYDGRLQSIGRTFLAKTAGDEEGGGFTSRELQSILSTAQEQTRPLDDIAHISDESDFSFENLSEQPTTIYIVLPALRIGTHARWLRVLIYQLLAAMERNPIDVEGGALPLRLILEEFPSLGYLQAIETAAGYIAGSGVQLWAVLQDLTQIRTHYPNSWETFLGNAGVIVAFSITDGTTTRYFSELLGNTTILESRQTKLSSHAMRSGDPGTDASPRSVPLLEPAEIRQAFARETGRQLLLVPDMPPIYMQRLPMEENHEEY